MADCTNLYNTYLTALAAEAVSFSRWAVSSAQAAAAQAQYNLDVQARYAAYAAWQQCVNSNQMLMAPGFSDTELEIFRHMEKVAQTMQRHADEMKTLHEAFIKSAAALS